MERKKEGKVSRPWQRALAKSPEAWVSYLLSATGLLWKLTEIFHTGEFLRSLAVHGFDPLWLVAAGILGLGLTVARAERRHGRSAMQAEMQGEGAPPRVTILEPPRLESLSPSGGERRMVTFPRVAVENVSSGPQRISLRLFLDGWDAAYIPPWKPPDFFTRGGPTKLPDEIDLQPGQQVVGQIEFRIPFAYPSEVSAVFRLVLIRPSTETVIAEFPAPLEPPSYFKKP
jgi:hypothetical protein